MRTYFTRVNRTLSLALFLAVAATATPPRVLVDLPQRWEAQWRLGSWSVDSSNTTRGIHAPGFGINSAPGALAVPVAEATLALPPDGQWSVEVLRDSLVPLSGTQWLRSPAWATNPMRSIPANPSSPPAWREESTPQGRILRLSIPWAELGATNLTLARDLRVKVTMSGSGSGPLGASLSSFVANPVGSSRFGRVASASGLRFAARGSATRAGLWPEGGQSLILTVRNPAVGDLSHDGMVRLTGSQIRAQLGTFSGVDFSKVAVGGHLRGPIPRDADSAISSGALQAFPIRRVDLDKDGVFDLEDRVEFFAQGPSYWTPDTSFGEGAHEMVVHPWDLSRRYLVRLDALDGSPDLPIATIAGSPSPVTTTLRPVWAGKHLQVRVPEIGSPSTPDHESGASWFWHWVESERLDSAKLRHPAARDLPGLAGSTGLGVVRLGRIAPSEFDTLRPYGGSSTLGTNWGRKISWNLGGLKPTDNRWSWLTMNSESDFESYTIHYPFAPSRSLAIAFPAPRTGSFSMPVSGTTESDTVLAVVEGVAVRAIALSGGLLRDSATTLDTWYVPLGQQATFTLAAWRGTNQARVLSPEELTGTSTKLDYVVVSPDSFLNVALEFADFRANPARLRPMETRIVRADDLWLLWGRGSVDPLAIRELLRKANASWGTSHAILLGGGHYDPRGVTGAAPVAIPVWEDQDVGTDAILTYLDPREMGASRTRTQDIALGRIPARSRAELSAWFDKLRVWEDPAMAVTGPWRNTFLGVADDMQVRTNGGSPDPIYHPNGDRGHTHVTERLLQDIQKVRPWAQLRKVYEVEYPSNAVLEKPDAQRALIDQLNRGVVAWQFMGHGGFDILTDERLLDTRSALAGLTNKEYPHIFYAGSCTVGRFDLADNRGLSEALLVAARKGAVAAISGTRPSYPDDNERLARNFWTAALSNPNPSRPTTLGEAFQKAQNSFTSGASDLQSLYPNSTVYNLLGDPAMIPFPAGSSLSLESTPDTIAALDATTVSGSAETHVQVQLIGKPQKQTATYVYGDDVYTQSYLSPGRTLVSMRTNAVQDRYAARLLTPARLPFGDTASIFVYGWNPVTLRDSAVIRSEILLAGIGANPPSDNEGPRIKILPCDSSWSAGQPFGTVAEIPVPFCLNVFFDDSSGISSSDAPDEGVILSIPGTLEPWHPSKLEEGANFAQTWTRLDIDEANFTAGKSYTLNVFARDLMGNASSKSIELRTRKAGEIDLYEVFNRPNPVKGDGTIFYFKLLAATDSNGTVPSTVQAAIRIHTLSGKLVRVLNTDLTEAGHPRPRAVWDLKDAFRNEVANGLYPYTILLRIRDSESGNWRQLEKRGIIAVSR